MKKLALILSLLALAAVGFAACGDDDDDDAAATTEETTTEETTAEDSGGSGGSVAITAAADGSLAFEQTEVSAPAGEVTVEFDNPASLPHDVVVETPTARSSSAPTRSAATRRPQAASSRPATTPSTARSPATARAAWRGRSRPSSKARPFAVRRCDRIGRYPADQGAADGLGDADGLLAALDLEGELGDRVEPAVAEVFDGLDLGGGSDLRASGDGCREADLVPAVVDAELDAARS